MEAVWFIQAILGVSFVADLSEHSLDLEEAKEERKQNRQEKGQEDKTTSRKRRSIQP